MKRALLLAILLFVAASARAEILTLFSDKGFPPSTAQYPVPVFGDNPNGYAAFGKNSDFAVPEGTTSFKMVYTAGGYGGWGFDYGSVQDFSRFTNGELRFWIYAPNGNVEVTIKRGPTGFPADLVYQSTLQNAGLWNAGMANRWSLIRIPLSGLNVNTMRLPFLFTAVGTPMTFYIDNVHYVTAGTPMPVFSARLCAMGDTACVTSPSQVTWTGATPASGWKLADQYIQLSVDADTTLWGVQMYTDNRAVDANPRYVVNGSSNPAGLVNLNAPTATIPLAWSIKAATGPVANVTPSRADPTNSGDPNSFQWIFMKDAQTPSIPSQNTTAFQNGQIDVTVRNNFGIHYGQNPLDVGAENSPNYLFLQANFGQALAQQTYRTSKLILEFYSL